MITTTLNRIRAHKPCAEDYKTLLAYLGKVKADNDPVLFATIVEAVGLDAALWCCRCEPQHNKTWRLFAVWCARQVSGLENNPRFTELLSVSERFAWGLSTERELMSAWGVPREADWGPLGYVGRVASWAAGKNFDWDRSRKAQTAKFLEMVGEAA